MASGIYNVLKADLFKKTHDFVNDTIRVMLLNNSHSFVAENDVKADIVANEISGTGYTANGAALASKAVTVDDTDDEGVFDAADLTWSTATITAYHAVIYDDTIASPADPLIGSIDFGGAQSSSAGDFTIAWAAEGIININ